MTEVNKQMPIIIIEDLVKTLQDKLVLNGLNLEVEPGETRVIVGGSGEGKSVLLKHIIGLMVPDRGRIIVDKIELDHTNPQSIDEIRRRVAMVFQGAALFDSLTVRDNVGFSLINLRQMPDEEIDRVVKEKLSLVNMEGIEKLMPAELSGGMKKRVAIARALATDPKIILFDEPTTGLDPLTADTINELILELKYKLKITQVVVTHDLHSSWKIADRISMLRQGKILLTATPHEMARTQDSYIRQFISAAAIPLS